MEYIKKEDLIEGEIYKIFNNNIKQYVYFKQNYTTNNQIHHLGFISEYNNYYVKEGYHGLLDPNFKITTSEEKHRLEECIKLDKFITFDEAMKSFIPEYVECTLQQIGSDYKLGKIYKMRAYGYIGDGFAHLSHNKNRFKPSTKEAYDAQFAIKEPEFVLPENWHIVITEENRDIIRGWWNSKNYPLRVFSIGFYYRHINDDERTYNINLYSNSNKPTSITTIEITFEQFKKYVLKEETVIEEVKIIEPLPQFKVIETIETITKVENNEGNQFFIGDIVKSPSNQKGEIISFKYSADKSNIIAITTFQINNGISINKIEHYIEPKVEVEPEFILPEKWCIKQNSQIINNWLNKNKQTDNHYTSIEGYHLIHFPAINGAHLYTKIHNGYIEITFDQFKKYVLKETEKPIVIAESIKDMLDLKSKGVDSIVLSQETLLEKAKRLYPIGTRFKTARGNNSEYLVKSYSEFRENLDSAICIETNGNGTVYFNKNWAEIIEYTHNFKISDKIKISTIPVNGSQPEYLNNNYKIIKIRGKQLLFETNSIPPINSVLAKNAIKVN